MRSRVYLAAALLALLAGSAAAQYFPAPLALPAGYTSRHVAISDRDLDGDRDILVSASSGAADAVIQLTNPGFAPSVLVPYPAGTGIEDLAVANLETANALPDVVTVHTTSGDLRVRLFPAGAQTVPLPAGMLPSRIALLDVERDGDLDVAVIGNGSPMIYLTNNAAGVFGAPYSPATLTVAPAAPLAIVAADFNADGTTDIVVARADGNMTLFLNTSPVGGPVSFAAGQTYSHPNTRPYGLCADDFNGDGWMDFASADAIGQATVFLNQGPPISGTWSTVNFAQTAYNLGGPNYGSWAIACTDFDCDGDVDLVVAQSFNAQVITLQNNGAGAFTVLAPIGVGPLPRDLAVGDLNGDLHPDVACANNGGPPDVSQLTNVGGPMLKPHVYVGGIQDGFLATSPTLAEDACPQPSFATYVGTPRRNFDDAPSLCARPFGHTFPNIGAGSQFPTEIIEAQLIVTMRPSCSSAGNDALALGFNAALNRFAFSNPISTLPGAGAWPTSLTLTLDLGNLPGGINLIPKMNTDGFLDIYVRDDTEVDSVVLRMRSCVKVRCLFDLKETPIIAGQNWVLGAGGAPPGSWIFWFMSPSVGPGPFLPAGQMCLLPPLFYLGAGFAPGGGASLTLPMPAVLPTPCVTVSCQAISILFTAPQVWCLSNTWTEQVFQ